MDFAKKIADAEAELTRCKDQIAETVAMVEGADPPRDFTEQENVEMEALAEKAEAQKTRIETLTRAEKALGLKAVKTQAPGVIKHAGERTDRPKGDLLFKMATASFLAHEHKMNLPAAVDKYYGDDADLAEVVKSAINPAATDVAGWAAELVDDSLQGFLDLLRGVSVGWELLGRAGTQLTFDRFGKITVPTREGANNTMRSGWTGERSAIPVRRATTGDIDIFPYKWGCISTFSKELAMRSTPSIEALVRQFIIADTGTTLDNDLFSEDAAVLGFRPAGILNGITGTPASTATEFIDKVNEDIKNLVKPLIGADCITDPVIYMNPENTLEMASAMSADGTFPFRAEIQAGNIMGYPLRESTNIPKTEHMIVDANELAASVGAPEFSASDTATIVEMDDDGTDPYMGENYPRNPSGQVGDAATYNSDPLNTDKAPIRSLFQTETVAVKHVQYLSWHRMRDVCVNRITGLAYGS